MAAAAATGPPDVDVTMKDLLSQPGVQGYMVFNDTGIPVKWSSTGFIPAGAPNSSQPIPSEVIHYAALMSDLQDKCRGTVQRLFSEDEAEDPSLQYFRMRTKMNEIIVAPGDGCTLVVLQSASSKPEEAKEETKEEK
mmetsp:Transcript_106837/g.297263  ORF Transcript_106837/g.297263 Transcript_106837/m.297263 type:complete len:137 (+) Transcript_106837:194-604(+)